jgi:O-succinylbenzoic acid--CoA ligase
MERGELKALLRVTGCVEERGEFWFLRDPAREGVGVPEAGQGGEGGAGWLGVPTGGTSGGVRYARHDELTLGAAVRGFCEHFGIERVNAVGVLPAYHVSGLMARVRCAATGGQHVAWDWKRLEAGAVPEMGGGAGPWMISLVPTQLQRMLAMPDAVAWLRRLAIIFLGGGPIWPSLAEAAARAELRVSLSYGMTETAAMVTALRPAEFLQGGRSSGTALPHARVAVNAAGVVEVAGASVFRGYFPEWRETRSFATEDSGDLDADGRLTVLGRRDAVIITGGKKVQPAEVEAALRASGEFADVAVIGVPDDEWGQAVVACYPADGRVPDVARATGALGGALKPKRFCAVTDWPRNAQGKINRAALLASVTDAKKLTA